MGSFLSKPSAAFLRTKVARRVLLLFFLCAMVPLGGWAIYSYIHTSRQLYSQSRDRVRLAARNTAQVVMERLGFVERDLDDVAVQLQAGAESVTEGVRERLSERFRSVQLVGQGGVVTAIYGETFAPPALSQKLQNHRLLGRSAIVDRPSGSLSTPLITRLVDPAAPERGALWAELSPAYVAVSGEDRPGVPYNMELCLLDEMGILIYCTLPLPPTTIEAWRSPGDPELPPNFDWSLDGERYVGGAQRIGMVWAYGTAGWFLALSEPRSIVLAPMYGFMEVFPWTILLAILIVLYVANVQIRNSMEPLEKLKEGTRRIAEKDFGSLVEVASKDEFEDLATSFNQMARRLGRQFNALTTINDIDRAVLSALDTEAIIETVLHRTRNVIECDGVALCLAQGSRKNPPWTLFAADADGRGQAVTTIRMAEEDIEALERHPEFFFVDAERAPKYLEGTPFADGGVRNFVVLPIFLKQKLSGVVALGYRDTPDLTEDDLVQARQLADQVAVALSNARLIEELDQFNWGALAALAQTVDAKSPWTAGHSQRVTRFSLMVARKMGLPAEQIDVLHRGGLLHDIGKIGVPAAILDKPGVLTPEEMQTMRDHVTVGARILTPIAAYLRHHERIDGTGYPDGLSGNEIPFLARLLAVPDVFDAVTSDRPYRDAWPRERALDFVAENTGTHFDPDVADAFRAVMSEPAPEIPEELSLVFPKVSA
jgi:putative nucleotidyltransferase with HDIG domain